MIFNCGTQLGGVAVRYLRRIFPNRDAGHRPEQLDEHEEEKYENIPYQKWKNREMCPRKQIGRAHV